VSFFEAPQKNKNKFLILNPKLNDPVLGREWLELYCVAKQKDDLRLGVKG
jgi:hypothetical protein